MAKEVTQLSLRSDVYIQYDSVQAVLTTVQPPTIHPASPSEAIKTSIRRKNGGQEEKKGGALLNYARRTIPRSSDWHIHWLQKDHEWVKIAMLMATQLPPASHEAHFNILLRVL